MTFDGFMVWSNMCPSCCGNTGRLLHGICKYAGERIVAHGPLVFVGLGGLVGCDQEVASSIPAVSATILSWSLIIKYIQEGQFRDFLSNFRKGP